MKRTRHGEQDYQERVKRRITTTKRRFREYDEDEDHDERNRRDAVLRYERGAPPFLLNNPYGYILNDVLDDA